MAMELVFSHCRLHSSLIEFKPHFCTYTSVIEDAERTSEGRLSLAESSQIPPTLHSGKQSVAGYVRFLG